MAKPGEFQISIDTRMLNESIDAHKLGLQAVEHTITDPPIGKVVVSIRKKLSGESGRVVHGMAIANFLRAQGKDPFDYPDELVNRVDDKLADDGEGLIYDAWISGRHRRKQMRALVSDCALMLAEWARENIKSGGLGARRVPVGAARERYMRRLMSLIKRGLVTTKHGTPPPRGVWSGRFVEGIRHLPGRT